MSLSPAVPRQQRSSNSFPVPSHRDSCIVFLRRDEPRSGTIGIMPGKCEVESGDISSASRDSALCSNKTAGSWHQSALSPCVISVSGVLS